MRRRSSGQAMTEFAIVAPLLFLMLMGLIDLMRAGAVNNTVAEAARLGVRQAIANQVVSDSPFGGSNGQPCQSDTFTNTASGSGCLTDARIYATVVKTLGSSVAGSTLYSNATAASCPLPASGSASVCIAPGESGAPGSYSNCAAARSALGRDPAPGDLGSRQAEWSNPQYKGCFLVQVTVVVRYLPITPVAGQFFPSVLRLASSTSTVAEY